MHGCEPPTKRFRRFVLPAAALLWLVFAGHHPVEHRRVADCVAPAPASAGSRASSRFRWNCAIPRGLAVLACIVTATPGTSWAHYEAAANVLTLHVLDLVDEEAWVRQFKAGMSGA